MRSGILVLLVAFALSGCASRKAAGIGAGVGLGLMVTGAVVGKDTSEHGPSGEGYAALALVSTGLVVLLGSVVALVLADPPKAAP